MTDRQRMWTVVVVLLGVILLVWGWNLWDAKQAREQRNRLLPDVGGTGVVG